MSEETHGGDEHEHEPDEHGLEERGLEERGLEERGLEERGLELWSGSIDEPDSLGFVGAKGRTLILARPGRGWLPTGRPAEPHPVDYALGL